MSKSDIIIKHGILLQERKIWREVPVKNEKGEWKEKIISFIRRNATPRILAVGIGLGILLLIALGLGKVISSESRTTKIVFEDIGELATQSAYCTEVNVTEAARSIFGLEIPFTQSKYIYSYDVVIKAGFDFNEIQWEEKDKVIRVKLPEAKILSSEIDTDSFQVYHEDESIFRQISLEENNEALAEMKKSAEETAIEDGLLENARANAETILKGFFAQAYDLQKYELQFTDGE